MKRIVIGILATMLVAGAQTKDEAERLFKAARNVELVDGNLNAAIKQYDAIIAKYRKTDRAVTATALVRKAECLQKQGDAEARKINEQVVKDYADQKEAVALAKARLGGGAPAGQQATRAVWTGPKADVWGSSVSPDGRFISFPDHDTGNLGLHDLVTGADRLLTNTGTYKRGEVACAGGSAISRDGKQVAYGWYDGKLDHYELRVLSLNGDPNPRRVFANTNVDYIEPRDWSPDGKWIAANLGYKHAQIGLIGAQDGSLRLLRTGKENLGMRGFSSDGRYILYTLEGPGGVSRGYIISADAKSEVPLVSGSSSAESPVWTPDGSRIVFVSDRSGSPGLWSIRVADGKPLGEPELLKAGFSNAQVGSFARDRSFFYHSNAQAMGFARDGSLFYEVGLREWDIYLAGLDPATGKLTSEPKRVNERATNSWGRLAWLPDGKSLSFWNRAPIDTLVVHTLSTGEEREIWHGKSRPGMGYAGWFPDGRTLTSTQVNGQTRVLRRMDSRTGEVQATWIVPDIVPWDQANPVFSPDRMTMYFWRKDQTVPCEGIKCTYVMAARDVETGRDREIFRINAGYLGNASISHDGRHLAFSTYGVARGVMVAPTAGGRPVRSTALRTAFPFRALPGRKTAPTCWHSVVCATEKERSGRFPRKAARPKNPRCACSLLGYPQPARMELKSPSSGSKVDRKSGS